MFVVNMPQSKLVTLIDNFVVLIHMTGSGFDKLAKPVDMLEYWSSVVVAYMSMNCSLCQLLSYDTLLG